MMWLAIHFPLLALECLWQGREKTALSLAVVEQQKIFLSNELAQQNGVQSGQSVATAYAIDPSLKVIERSKARELQQIEAMALLAYPFSSQVCMFNSDTLVLEIAGSLRLFSGLESLLGKVEGRFRSDNFLIRLGLAHTPKAASLMTHFALAKSLSCWQENQLDQQQIMAQLSDLSLACLPLSSKQLQQINRLGFTQLKSLLSLPLSSLKKRLGSALVIYLQQLRGLSSDPQLCFQPPTIFTRQLDFIDVIHHAETLIFPMQRLLSALVDFLRLHQQSAQELLWQMQDIYGQKSDFSVRLSEAEINYAVYLELTRLHLQKVNLTGPVESIRLSVSALSELLLPELSLFKLAETFTDRQHFIHKIRARYGEQSCLRLLTSTQQVPELRNRILTCAQFERAPSLKAKNPAEKKTDTDLALKTFRPSWLLKSPQAIGHSEEKLYWQGKLELLSHEERINQYWWKKPVNRGYYVAQHASGQLLWVFYDYDKCSWYVHGIF